MLASLLLLLAGPSEPLPWFDLPAGSEFARVVPGGRTILPSGKFLTPTGKRLYTGTDLWQVLLSPDGKSLVGFDEGGLTVYTDLEGSSPSRKAVPFKSLAPCGAFTPDGSHLVVSLGDAGRIALANASTWEVVAEIPIDDLKDSYVNDLAISPDGRYAFGVDVANQDLLTFDLPARKLVSRTKAGRQPYAIALSVDGKTLFVANIGLFDYSVVDLDRPAFGFPSRESEVGTVVDGTKVPGIGKPGSPDAQSVWKYDVTDPTRPTVARKAVSGLLIHRPADGGKAVGGSAPNELLLDGSTLYVANANSDTVSVFDAATLKVRRTIKLAPQPALAKYRGVIPSGMALDRKRQRLFVSESGLNAVAVVDTRTGKVLGHFPTGWFPVQLALSPDGTRLGIGTHKGLGRGPLGAFHRREPGDERYGLHDIPGMIDWTAIPGDLAASTRTVLANNGLVPKQLKAGPNPVPWKPGKASDQIKHVVFITKENHTFDGIFGADIPGSRGEPRYAEYGLNGWIREKGQAERLPIMPNHIRLARQFAISDNFYMEPHASGDGHRWLVGVYPSLWTSRVFYAGWNFVASDRAKGRLTSMGSNGSQIPEDYLENGSIWEHLSRGGLSFRNYGEGYELPGSGEPFPVSRTGTNYQVNHPMPKVLFDNTDFNFPAYNNNIPDIARAKWFEEDVERTFRAKGKPLPRFMNIAICNDHGDSPRPEFGFPYFSSYLADNDLALGRIVEYLSRTPEWKNMAIFVTQDDSGGDNDHVDRHRSYVMVISPYAKRGYVTHEHTSIMSIIRTIYLTFGLGPNNLFDAVATPLHDMFTTKPDFTPYTHIPVDPRVFKPEATVDPSDPRFLKRRKMTSTPMDDPDFLERLNREGG